MTRLGSGLEGENLAGRGESIAALLRHIDRTVIRGDDLGHDDFFVERCAGDMLLCAENEPDHVPNNLDVGNFGRKNVLHWNRFHNRPALGNPSHGFAPGQQTTLADERKTYRHSYELHNHMCASQPSRPRVDATPQVVGKSIQFLIVDAVAAPTQHVGGGR